MKPKHLPRLWCALQGLLPLDGRKGIRREAAGDSPSELETRKSALGCDPQIRAVLSVVAKETNVAI
jgi:hypothetical protein